MHIIIKQLHYKLDEIFNERTSVEHIFDRLGRPLVRDLINNVNGLLVTYGTPNGQAACTLLGDECEPGLIARSLELLFESLAFQQTQHSQVGGSFALIHVQCLHTI